MKIRIAGSLLVVLAAGGCAGTPSSSGARFGSVEIECTVLETGAVSDCVVLSERPEGQGFGQAALETATRGRVRLGEGVAPAPGGKVRFTTRFQLQN